MKHSALVGGLHCCSLSTRNSPIRMQIARAEAHGERRHLVRFPPAQYALMAVVKVTCAPHLFRPCSFPPRCSFYYIGLPIR